MITNPVTLEQQATRTEHVLFQVVGGETVLLDLETEQYFGLDPVGTRIWQLLAEPSPLRSIFRALCNEYDADPARIQADLIALIHDLNRAGLVKIT